MTITLLRQMREASGLSLEAIAFAAKLHSNTVQRVFNGERVATSTTQSVGSVLRKALEEQRIKADELLRKSSAVA